MVTLISIGILRDRVSKTPTSSYKKQNRARVTPEWGWERTGIFLAKEEELFRYIRSGN